MRFTDILLSAALLTAGCCLPTACDRKPASAPISAIEEGFMTPPDSIGVAANWWVSEDLSLENVVDDFTSMKNAGVTRVIICFDVRDDSVMDSEHWWQILHQALKTAGDLDIEVGISNLPGRSHNIKPEQSMRRIVSAWTVVEGPGMQTIDLPEIEGEYQDVAVVAYPLFEHESYSQTWTLKKNAGLPLSTKLELDTTVTVRSIEVNVDTPMRTEGIVSIKDNGEWKEARRFDIDRSNVGSVDGIPVIISLPESEVSEVLFEVAEPGAGEIEVTLSEQPKVERIAEKQLVRMGRAYDYSAWNDQPDYTTSDWTVDTKNVIVITPDIYDGELDPGVKQGRLEKDVPPGRWVIARIAMTPVSTEALSHTVADGGMAFDKMNKDNLQKQVNGYMKEILRRIPAEDRKTFRMIVDDSYDADGQNWTDNMTDEFYSRYGYSPMLFMPVFRGITVGSNDISERFLWDLRRIVADMVATEYIGGLRESAHDNGLRLLLKSNGRGGRSGDFLLSAGQSDEIAGDSRSVDGSGVINNRILASGGHIYGKDRIWSEVGAAAVMQSGLHSNVDKKRADRLLAEGVNAPILDLVSVRGDSLTASCAAGLADSTGVAIDYLRRCGYLLQQGRYVADVAYFRGEDVPTTVTGGNPVLPAGYSFDFINADVLKNHARVKNGRLVLDSGMEYSVLMLPNRTIRPEMIERIEQLVKDGLTVVGHAPERSPSLAHYPLAHATVIETASRMWSPDGKVNKVGKGKVWNADTDMSEVMADLNIVPDLSVGEGESMPLFTHRRLGDAEIYFISNPSAERLSINPTFRVKSGMVPQLWNAVDGSVRSIEQFTPAATGEGVTVPVVLDPSESVFVVFRKKA